MTDGSVLSAKKEVDALSDEEVFRIWRFSPTGDPMLTGSKSVFLMLWVVKLRTEDPEEYTRISKKIGWKE